MQKLNLQPPLQVQTREEAQMTQTGHVGICVNLWILVQVNPRLHNGWQLDSDRGINHTVREDDSPEFRVANATANYPPVFVMFHNFKHQNSPTKAHIHQSKEMYYNTK